MMVSFCAVLFPRDVLDEILNLIESVSEGCPTYYFTCTRPPRVSSHYENAGSGLSFFAAACFFPIYSDVPWIEWSSFVLWTVKLEIIYVFELKLTRQ